MGEPIDDAWGKEVVGESKLETSSPSSSTGGGFCDTSSSHNDSDGILSSLTNDDSRSGKHNANTGRSAESSEGSLSSSSSDDLVKKKSHVVGSEGAFERASHSEISCRKRKSQPVSVASSSPSQAIHIGSGMVVAGCGGIKEPNQLPGKKSKLGLAGSKVSKDGKRSSSRKKKDINLATVEGQLAANPGLSEEEARAAAKREYHRQNAALARVRNKEMVSQLKRTVSDLTRRSTDLQRANDVLRSQLEILSKQNADLVKSRTARTANALAAAPASPPEASAVSRYPAATPPSNDPSALLLLQVMSSLLQAPQGFAPQGMNLLESLMKIQAPLMNQTHAPVSPVSGLDPVVVGQILALLQGQVAQPQVNPSIVPTQHLPSPSPAQPIRQAQALKDSPMNPSTQAQSLPQVASERQRLECLLGLSSGSSSMSQQAFGSSLPQHSSPATLPVLPAVVSDAKPSQQERSVQRIAQNSETPTPAILDPSSSRLTALATGPPATNDATSSDLQASQLMLLLRSLSQQSASAQPR